MTEFLERYPMLLLALEAAAALALLIFIVVWTMSGAKKHPPTPKSTNERPRDEA
jgi:hypothetical protein